MSRSYSFEHFTAAKPVVSPWKRASAHEKQTMTRAPMPLQYGHAHAHTELIYQRHREEHARQEAMRIPEVRQEPQGAEAPPPMQAREARRPRLFEREGLQELGWRAVDSVRRAAREAARGRPLQGMRRLADDAVSGTLEVVREASDHVSRLASDLSTEQAKKPRSSR